MDVFIIKINTRIPCSLGAANLALCPGYYLGSLGFVFVALLLNAGVGVQCGGHLICQGTGLGGSVVQGLVR